MKQMLILERSDVDRLKRGEVIELTNGLLLGMQVKQKKDVAENYTDTIAPITESIKDKRRRARRILYGKRYRAKKKRERRAAERGHFVSMQKRATTPTPCPLGCGKMLNSGQAFGGHKAACPNNPKRKR